MKSYLSNRKQVERINNLHSKDLSIKCGGLQGTILGPILFLFYINGIFNVLPEGEIVSFETNNNVCTCIII